MKSASDLTVVAASLTLGLAAFLIISAAGKAGSPGRAAEALIRVGFPRPLSHVAVVFGSLVEGGVAVAVVLAPRSSIVQALCLGLFALFGMMGAIALFTGQTGECGCMGSIHRSTLGWLQLKQLAIVIAIVLLMHWYAPTWDLNDGVALLFTLIAVSAGALLGVMAPTSLRTRAARRSIAATGCACS